MRVAHIDGDALKGGLAYLGPGLAEDVDLAHPDADAGVDFVRVLDGDVLDPGAGVHVELVGVFESLGLEHVGEGTDAVAAHLGDGAVGVAVVHKPRAVGTHYPQQPVAANTGAAITEPGHLRRCELELIVDVDEHDEVVFRGVGLDEVQRGCHACESIAGASSTAKACSSVLPAAASSQEMRWSRLNQERWRRT